MKRRQAKALLIRLSQEQVSVNLYVEDVTECCCVLQLSEKHLIPIINRPQCCEILLGYREVFLPYGVVLYESKSIEDRRTGSGGFCVYAAILYSSVAFAERVDQ